jgi:hypothetical protein
MPSRRRSRNKNLGNNLADVQRRLRNMERRPVRTKLQNRVVTTAAIAVNAVGPDEVSFGTTVITDAAVNTIENPKDGLLVINETAGTTSVYSEEQKNYIQLPAVDDDARTVANGKNTIYYQNSAPSGGTYAVDDTWFDSDDGYKMYTWTGSAWSGFELGNSAIASISATKITAGSLAAGVIVTSNLSAGQITTGSLSSAVIATTALNANNITTGTITGVTFQTSAINTGRSVQITDDDNIVFRTTSSDYPTTPGIVGLITVINQTFSDSEADDSWAFNDAVMMSGLENSLPAQGAPVFPMLASSGTGSGGVAGLFGSSATYVTAFSDIVEVAGNSLSVYSDVILFNAGYGDNNGDRWRFEIIGPVVLDYDLGGEFWQGEPLSLGSGQPSQNGFANGHIVFRYT